METTHVRGARQTHLQLRALPGLPRGRILGVHQRPVHASDRLRDDRLQRFAWEHNEITRSRRRIHRQSESWSRLGKEREVTKRSAVTYVATTGRPPRSIGPPLLSRPIQTSHHIVRRAPESTDGMTTKTARARTLLVGLDEVVQRRVVLPRLRLEDALLDHREPLDDGPPKLRRVPKRAS